jgi:periplasmic copper chaperone A
MRRAFAIAVVCMLAACSADRAPLVATDIDLRQPLPGTQTGAGYLTLSNNTADPITITKVTSPQYGEVQMHESVIENGIARMRPLDSVTVPPHGSMRFEPGARHLMLMRPTGSQDGTTLHFLTGDAVVLTLTVPTRRD